MADPASISAFVASWLTPSSLFLFLFLNLVIGTIALTSRFATPRKPSDQHHDDASSPPLLRRSSSLVERVRSFHFYRYDTTFPETGYVQPLQDSPHLVRTPSLIERVKSINFGFYSNYEPTVAETETVRPDDPAESENPTQPPLERSPSLLQRLKSMNFSSLYRSDSTTSARECEGEVEADVKQVRPDHESGNLVRRSKSETRKGSPARLPEKMKKSASENSASRRPDEEDDGVAAAERRRPVTARTGERSEMTSFGEDEAVDAKADDFIHRFKQQLRLQRLDSMLRRRENAN